MRTLCDVCESAAAILFCAADEAALCSACDVKVHMCNKLANRHMRVGLAEPSEVQRCDICENEPAFFYCEVDGTSLCLQCDMIVHVGGKRTHGRYLLLRQRVEFPGDKPVSLGDPGLGRGNLVETKMEPARASSFRTKEAHQNRHVSFGPDTVNKDYMENNMIDLRASLMRDQNFGPFWSLRNQNILRDQKGRKFWSLLRFCVDLNARPQRMHGEAPRSQEHANALFDNNHECEGVVPD